MSQIELRRRLSLLGQRPHFSISPVIVAFVISRFAVIETGMSKPGESDQYRHKKQE
jgi:hypothetical protein